MSIFLIKPHAEIIKIVDPPLHTLAGITATLLTLEKQIKKLPIKLSFSLR